MIDYIIEAVTDVMSLLLILAIMYAYVALAFSQKEKTIFLLFTAAGFLGAAVMSYMKNATALIDTSWWNLRIFCVTLVAFIIFVIASKLEHRLVKLHLVSVCALSIVSAMLLFYVLPDFLAYPYAIYVAVTTVFTTEYILKLSGVIVGFLIVLVAAVATYKNAVRLSARGAYRALVLVLLINEIKQVGSSFSIMLARRIISSNTYLFNFAKYTANYSNWFIYLTMAVAVGIAGVFIARSFHVTEPYTNSAQHRKIRAKWRTIKRYAAASITCCVLSVLLMTAIKELVTVKIELSPIEDTIVENGCVYIPFDQVNDGHLHRFGYETENGVVVRFIVIQKPGTQTYGIGLDACEICGDTGYYELDGQVICNRCDVAMNITTIGYKGGCNPIIFDYSISNGNIIVPVENLAQFESEFA